MEHDILISDGTDIHLTRYFEYNGDKYLIFTRDGIDEKDEQGHVFVHICEIKDLMATAVEGDKYETMKNVIKDIVTKNKNNIPLSIIDLNYNDLSGLNIINDKQLGLLQNYVDLLKQNQPDFQDMNFSEPSPFTIEEHIDNSNIVEEQDEYTENNPVFDNSNFIPFNIEFEESKNGEEENIDYKKMYLEQYELVKHLSFEIEIYKTKIENIKNIINN